ncbi:RNA recognition motif 2-domain-containing protein [Exophiala viscosa]|uniref:RNA recognition motif 2-domain-containing protein n=1 Tax=Exophiala viscosa TaxID=2486360 RepID=A0AAN6E4G8_9EURO|nr:RNA recognition motif 2-domain-containing protein [Exophiala viscosa]
MSPPRGSASASSPHSEHDTTFHGTPSTNITSFTPEGVPGTKGKGRAVDFYTGDPEGVDIYTKAREATKATHVPKPAKHASVADDDVFLSAPTPTNGPLLSPTAEVFEPQFSHPTAAKVPSAPRVYRANGFAPVQPAPIIGHAYGAHAFPKNAAPTGNIGAQRKTPGVIGGTNVDTDNEKYLDLLMCQNQIQLHYKSPVVSNIWMHDIHLSEGEFSTDMNSIRAFTVLGLPAEFRSPSRRIVDAFKPEVFPSIKSINAAQVVTGGLFTVAFDDVRDAKRALHVAANLAPHTRVFPMKLKAVAADQGRDPTLETEYAGQIVISAYYNGNPSQPPIKAHPVVIEIKRLLKQCGDIKAFHTMPPNQLHCREFRAEFYNAANVACAKDVISGTVINGTVLDVELYTPDIRPVVLDDLDDLEIPFQKLSVTGRSTVPVDSDYDRLAYVIQRDAARNGRRGNQNGNHNAVDIARIQSGADVRTTIMLRNIPNRVDQPMLKELLDRTSAGRYDFMYLRIDFANNCNVGYAFINFVDAPSIIPFVLARAGKRWNCFNSDKVAEVSYATIQGKDCLVQKFRNSSVMLEHPAFRPKLYVAGNVPNAGQEEKFPGPDNASKMRRSVENAEHVGLYIPEKLALALRNPNPNPNTRPAFPEPQPPRPVARFERPQGFYLPPARAAPDATDAYTFLGRVSRSFLLPQSSVDVNSPHDPFAGNPRPFS